MSKQREGRVWLVLLSFVNVFFAWTWCWIFGCVCWEPKVSQGPSVSKHREGRVCLFLVSFVNVFFAWTWCWIFHNVLVLLWGHLDGPLRTILTILNKKNK